ncbi:MAG: hypothetical protein ACYTF8_11090 [Planctomycetota bacterium]
MVYGEDKVDEHVNFNIGGQIEVNGEIAGDYHAGDIYMVTLVFRMEADLWFVDTMIENSAGGLVCMQMGHPLEGAMPVMITATAGHVIFLTAR